MMGRIEEIDLLGDTNDETADPADLDADMERLAVQLVKTAMLATTPIEDSVDIFKAVATYRLGMKKIKVPEAPKSNGSSFTNMRDRINGASRATPAN